MTINIADDLELPDPLTTLAGKKITTSGDWQEIRRPELLSLFRSNIYGITPIGRPDNLRFTVASTDTQAMGGDATLKRVEISFSGPGGKGVIKLELFIPNKAPKPVPGFLLICNRGREHMDPTRKIQSSFWPAERIVERGYIAAAFHVEDLDPDEDDGFNNGVHGIFASGEAQRPSDAWGTIAAWAWGASRVMDYFETDPDVDEKCIGVSGHSRGGKTALWCGAQDERFSLVISNDSGCTGAALARGKKGETIAKINKRFPHWFCANYKNFNDREIELPVDQHELIALIAPRSVYVASASLDAWAHPEGEFLSCVHAEPVYRLFGLQGMGTKKFPKPESPLKTGSIGYHLRTGTHDLTEYDWKCFMDFADIRWKEAR